MLFLFKTAIVLHIFET